MSLSAKEGGFIRVGSDQMKAAKIAEQNKLQKELARRPGEILDQEVDGMPSEKMAFVEEIAQIRLTKEGGSSIVTDKEKQLNETENTLKFAVFCLAFMYFRAMSLVQREKSSWAGKDSVAGVTKEVKEHTEERKRMMQEGKNEEYRRMELKKVMTIAARGEGTKALRAENERNAAAKRAYEVIRRAKKQKKGANHMQRLYRGHIGRKAARRWAMKKAELEAMNALMHASALTMERTFRGYVGRVHAAEKRAEMAEFIAMIRMEEAAADEEDYWRTHTFARIERDWKAFVASWTRKEKVSSEVEVFNNHLNELGLP